MGLLKIDLNCDIGEGVPNEDLLMPFLSSCNIACGGHHGNIYTMQRTIALALSQNVKIGAHPSYPDKENFGRKTISISNDDLKENIQKQLNNFEIALKKENGKLHHIKPHGALYNDVAKDENKANVFLKSIEKYKKAAYLYAPYASVILSLAMKKGYMVKVEAFADRNYNANYSLVSRTFPNAVINAKENVLHHVIQMVKESKIESVTGKKLIMNADTYCLHGDNSNAAEILKYLFKELPKHNIIVQ